MFLIRLVQRAEGSCAHSHRLGRLGFYVVILATVGFGAGAWHTQHMGTSGLNLKASETSADGKPRPTQTALNNYRIGKSASVDQAEALPQRHSSAAGSRGHELELL
jgi:hypothetical protein